MAGNTGMEERENQWKWKVQYSRCFNYPCSYSSSSSSSCSSSSSSHLIPIKRNMFKSTWISSTIGGSAVVSLHPSADGSSTSDDSVLTVSLLGTVIEEHFISKLLFTWPHVSCLSGFPARGSLVVFASYIDTADEKQKFALRFSTITETEDFITSVENILSNKLPNGLPAVDVVSALSSESEFIPPYRPEMSSVMTPTCVSPTQACSHSEERQVSQALDLATDSQIKVAAFPPRFTSLVSNCSVEMEQGNMALALRDGSTALALRDVTNDLNLKEQIAKYMQDASFLDMLTKVNGVIKELGEDFVL